MSGLSRRAFVQGAGVAGLGLLVGCGRLPWAAGPTSRLPRVGYLSERFESSEQDRELPRAFREGMREHGYVEGQTIALDFRYADGQPERLPELAAQLVALPVDVLVVRGTAETQAAKATTTSLPIVMVSTADPVAAGLVVSLAHPGGNVTGLSTLQGALAGKQLELLKEALPGVSRVAALWNAANAAMAQLLPQMQDAARALGLVVSSLGIQRVDELEGAFARAAEHQEESILALADYPSRNIGDVPTLALRHGLPTMFLESESARAGGLMSYGPNVPAEHRRAAYYVDRILKGAQPAELPVEQPREFDFVINLKTAEAVGLTIPQHVLIQATEVIQ